MRRPRAGRCWAARLGRAMLLALLCVAGCRDASSGPFGEAVLVVGLELLEDDVTRVREARVWQGGHGPPNRELELERISGAFPLRPTLELVSATIDGEPLDVDVRRYDDWLDLDFALPPRATPGPRHRLDLEYELRGAWRAQDDGVEVLRMQQLGPHSPLTYRNVTLRVVAPADAALDLWVAHGYGAYERVPLERRDEDPRASTEPERAAQVWVASLGPSPPQQPLLWQLAVRSPSFEPRPPPYLATLVEQAGVVPWALLVVIVAALGLRGQPADRVIAGTRWLHAGLLLVAAWELLGQQIRYWWGEAGVPGVEHGTALAEVAASAGLVALLAAFLGAQNRGLRERRAEAYALEPVLPLTLALALPMSSVRTAYLLLPLLGLPGLVAWLRRPVALAMGAELHRLVEAVQTHGTVAVPTLATELRLRPTAIRALLERNPELPVVHERDEDQVLSASVAALRDDLRLCPSCGGATRIAGQDRLACPYCEREYASAHVPDAAAPVPLLVRSLVAFLDVLGRGLMAWAGLLGGAFVLMAVLGDEDMTVVGALVAAAVMLMVAHGARTLLRLLAKGLGAGKGYGAILVLLALASPLVVPAILLWGFRSPRVRLFFGRWDLRALAQELQQRGQLPLTELAQRLRTRWDEAYDVAVHLCGNGRLDAVLDRAGSRLVARSRLRELAEAGTCRRCGGIVGIVRGTVRCHHCGTTAAA